MNNILDSIDQKYHGSKKNLESDQSLVYWLQYYAQHTPEQIALHLITDKGDKYINYCEFERKVRALAVELIKHTQKGDRAILLFDNDENYAISFYACLFAGVIAVPVFPPQSTQKEQFTRLSAIIKNAEPNLILTSKFIKPLLSLFKGALGVKKVLAVDKVKDLQADDFVNADRGVHEIAFLQYTSGSTGQPKGVMVTHDNLIANEKSILISMLEMTPLEDCMVSWLPMYHDMGLIGGLLAPLYRGGKLILMSPLLFLKSPERWLQVISQYKGTVTAAPDFAYRLCCERISDEVIATLDLSCIKMMLSGAEPVKEDTLRRFADRFQSCGFDPKAFTPCYGLAENTLYVSGTDMKSDMTIAFFDGDALEKHTIQEVSHDTPNAVKLVGNGNVAYDHTVQITQIDGIEHVADNVIGEILVTGASVTQGYWRNPEATNQAFVDINQQRWVRTGDLGFLYNDELFVTGRIKDIIIINGRNYYPQDIEQGIEADVDVIKKGRTVAFTVQTPEGSEGVGVAVEVAKPIQNVIDPQALIQEIHSIVTQHCQQSASVVLLLQPKSILKTSSGKLQRSACKQYWQENKFKWFAKDEFSQIVIK